MRQRMAVTHDQINKVFAKFAREGKLTLLLANGEQIILHELASTQLPILCKWLNSYGVSGASDGMFSALAPDPLKPGKIPTPSRALATAAGGPPLKQREREE